MKRLVAVALLVLAASGSLHAQDRTIKLIVPSTAAFGVLLAFEESKQAR